MEVDDDLGFEIGVSDNEFELENEYVDISEGKGGEHESMEVEEKAPDSLEDGEHKNDQGSSKQQDLREKLAKKRKQKKHKKERQKNGDHERDDEHLQRSKFYGNAPCAECGTCNSLACYSGNFKQLFRTDNREQRGVSLRDLVKLCRQKSF